MKGIILIFTVFSLNKVSTQDITYERANESSSKVYCSENAIIKKGVTKSQIIEILNAHNHFRLQVANGKIPNQPKAANMLKLTWDVQLAEIAQNQIDKCYFENNVVDQRFRVGHNYYTSMSTFLKPNANWTEAVKAWFHQLYNTKYLYGPKKYNSYTQVVWADSRVIGCGFIHYLEYNIWYSKLYICYYGPSGNLYGLLPYKIGNGCETLCKYDIKLH